MAVVARILCASALTGAVVGGLGFLYPSPWQIPTLCFACVGGVIGAVAGAGAEIVHALRHPPTGS